MDSDYIDIEVTGGPWIVRECVSHAIPNHLSICRADDLSVVIAIVPPQDGKPNWQTAALLASSKELLAAMTKVYNTVNGSKNVFNISEINTPIIEVAQKIRNEANL
jgi:hypothetical protein